MRDTRRGLTQGQGLPGRPQLVNFHYMFTAKGRGRADAVVCDGCSETVAFQWRKASRIGYRLTLNAADRAVSEKFTPGGNEQLKIRS